ncbi:hypothetical protein DFH11DRAFT_1548740 [Phellopilus nigrolimitatus]|nr:hypothetical protein DFH11DRAFT_1548740 [Phellopilus nigrolimitatus]
MTSIRLKRLNLIVRQTKTLVDNSLHALIDSNAPKPKAEALTPPSVYIIPPVQPTLVGSEECEPGPEPRLFAVSSMSDGSECLDSCSAASGSFTSVSLGSVAVSDVARADADGESLATPCTADVEHARELAEVSEYPPPLSESEPLLPSSLHVPPTTQPFLAESVRESGHASELDSLNLRDDRCGLVSPVPGNASLLDQKGTDRPLGAHHTLLLSPPPSPCSSPTSLSTASRPLKRLNSLVRQTKTLVDGSLHALLDSRAPKTKLDILDPPSVCIVPPTQPMVGVSEHEAAAAFECGSPRSDRIFSISSTSDGEDSSMSVSIESFASPDVSATSVDGESPATSFASETEMENSGCCSAEPEALDTASSLLAEMESAAAQPAVSEFAFTSPKPFDVLPVFWNPDGCRGRYPRTFPMPAHTHPLAGPSLPPASTPLAHAPRPAKRTPPPPPPAPAPWAVFEAEEHAIHKRFVGIASPAVLEDVAGENARAEWRDAGAERSRVSFVGRIRMFWRAAA